MPLPKNKEEAIHNLWDSFQKLDQEYEVLNQESTKVKGLEGNISACDLLAYQIGWGKLLLSWERDESKGKVPNMPAKGFKWNELGSLANSFYLQYQDKDINYLRKEFKRTVKKIEQLILSLSNEDVFTPKQREWTGEKWPMIKWIQINTIAPYKSGRTKLRRWKKSLDL